MKRKKFGKTSIWEVIFYLFACLLLIGLIGTAAWCRMSGCEGDREEAKRVVEGAGYTKIEIGGPHAWKCGQDDSVSNTFTAIGPNGNYVEGTVCCSFMGCAKGCTLRFE